MHLTVQENAGPKPWSKSEGRVCCLHSKGVGGTVRWKMIKGRSVDIRWTMTIAWEVISGQPFICVTKSHLAFKRMAPGGMQVPSSMSVCSWGSWGFDVLPFACGSHLKPIGQWTRSRWLHFNPFNGIQSSAFYWRDKPDSNICLSVIPGLSHCLPPAAILTPAFLLSIWSRPGTRTTWRKLLCENLGFWVTFWNQTSAPLLLHVLLWCRCLHYWVHFWYQSSFCIWVVVVEASMLATSTLSLHQE